jgi:hypothetical protein
MSLSFEQLLKPSGVYARDSWKQLVRCELVGHLTAPVRRVCVFDRTSEALLHIGTEMVVRGKPGNLGLSALRILVW